jgi:DNA repair protein RadC
VPVSWIFVVKKLSMQDSIKHWAVEDQPIYKLYTKGAKHLSTAELLAIILQHGTANQNAIQMARTLLASTQHNFKKLAGFTLKDILNLNIKGIGKVKAVRILAAIELGSRRLDTHYPKTAISQSSDVVQYLRNSLQYEPKEYFMILLLNQANKIIHEEILSEGGITGTIADPRIIFKTALAYSATGFIICHNHPSGQLRPSNMDDRLTEKVKKGAQVFDLQLIDHIIVSTEGYYSYAEQACNW